MGGKIRIIHSGNVARVTLHSVPDEPGIAARIFSLLGNHGISVELISQTSAKTKHTDISFAVVKIDLGQVVSLFQRIKDSIGAKNISFDRHMAMISVYGSDLGTQSGIAGQIFSALAAKGVNIEMISTSLSSITCVVAEKNSNAALEALNSLFENTQNSS
jgi:aspartate kinase